MSVFAYPPKNEEEIFRYSTKECGIITSTEDQKYFALGCHSCLKKFLYFDAFIEHIHTKHMSCENDETNSLGRRGGGMYAHSKSNDEPNKLTRRLENDSKEDLTTLLQSPELMIKEEKSRDDEDNEGVVIKNEPLTSDDDYAGVMGNSLGCYNGEYNDDVEQNNSGDDANGYDLVEKSVFEIRKDDDLPDKICEACLRNLWKAKTFRIDCQRGHRDLVQMVMERNAILYKIELEEENKYCSEFITISKPNNDYESLDSLLKLEQETFMNPNENNEDITAKKKANSRNVEYESSNSNIKQYCVVTRNDKDQENLENPKKSHEKTPIVLLLKLKDIPDEEKRKEAYRTSAVRDGTNKTDNKLNENYILKYKKTKAKGILKAKLNRKKANFTCKLCKKTYATYELLRHHTYIHKKPHQCKICHMRFSQSQSFLNHSNLHTGKNPYKCRICYKTFADITNRNSHERDRHKKQEFKCEKCNKKFRFLTLLQKHSQSHRPKMCFICNKQFSSLQVVRGHHQRKHLKLKEFKNN